MSDIISVETIAGRIFLIRGMKVILDADLAELYGVTTKALNQAVTRNEQRFPSDFMFRLAKEEKQELVTNCDRLNRLKQEYLIKLSEEISSVSRKILCLL